MPRRRRPLGPIVLAFSLGFARCPQVSGPDLGWWVAGLTDVVRHVASVEPRPTPVDRAFGRGLRFRAWP